VFIQSKKSPYDISLLKYISRKSDVVNLFTLSQQKVLTILSGSDVGLQFTERFEGGIKVLRESIFVRGSNHEGVFCLAQIAPCVGGEPISCGTAEHTVLVDFADDDEYGVFFVPFVFEHAGGAILTPTHGGQKCGGRDIVGQSVQSVAVLWAVKRHVVVDDEATKALVYWSI
jgi:hypothetical protein